MLKTIRKIISKLTAVKEEANVLLVEASRELRPVGQLKNIPVEEWTEEEKASGIALAKMMVELKRVAQFEWPQQIKDASSLLLQHYGWHVRLDIAFGDLVPFMHKGDHEVDRYMINGLNSSIKEISELAVLRFPERAKMINLAFTAHNRNEYELSVPAFLILSEGIFREMSNADIFGKSARAKARKNEFIEKLKKDNEIISLLPYTIEAVIDGDIIGLNFSKQDYLKFPNVLHRNLIIHGESKDYGTRTNSFKAISQFEFVIRFVYMAFTKGKVSDL
ncbi:hypothetical protein WG904_11130 [Pedobacter sp. Du54]|uniref:hypothetical protein n=1 Tax=Pedobacter anseongensis TaxID=3133439 RepID=UPI0030AE4893